MQGITSAINQSINHQISETSAQQVKNEPASSTQSSSYTPSADSVSLSSQGQSLNKLDQLFGQVDAIYENYMSKNDLKKTEEIYQKLEKMGSGQDDEAFNRQAEPLFEQLNKIFSDVESRFSKQDAAKLDQLYQQIDQEEEGQFGKIDSLVEEQDNLLLSKLSAKDKQQVENLNKQLEALFSGNFQSEEDQETINSLFESLDKTLNKGYQQLNDQERARVDGLSQQIGQLEEQLGDFGDE